MAGCALLQYNLTMILTVKSCLIITVNQPLYFQWSINFSFNKDNNSESTPLFPVEQENYQLLK